MSPRSALAVALASAALAGACASAPAWRATSPDHGTSLDVVARGKRACVTIAGRRDGCWDAVSLDGIAFSARGGRVAYPARIEGRWTIVRDGRPGARWEGVGAPVLSASGDRLAYAALDGGRWRVVADDSAGPPVDAVLAGSLAFDGDGRRLAYAARRGESTLVVVDGVPGEGWDGVGPIRFGGALVAHAARRAGRVHLVLNGAALPAAHEAIGEVALAASGARWGYAAKDLGRWRVVTPEGALGPFDSVWALAHAPPDEALTFVVRDGGRAVLIRGGAAVARHDSLRAPVFARRGGRWGYVAHDAGGSAAVVDGRVIAREPWIGDLALGAGERLAWVARRGDSVAVVDERGRHAFDLVVDGTLQFVRDGASWACLAGDRARRRLWVVVDGVPTGRAFDWSEMARLARLGSGEEAIRAWVAAAAR